MVTEVKRVYKYVWSYDRPHGRWYAGLSDRRESPGNWYQALEDYQVLCEKGSKGLDLSNVTAVCIDETSEKKGHKYITVFADPNSRRVIYVCKGKDADTVGSFGEPLKTARGYNLKLSVQMFWTISDPNLAEKYLKK